jgi:hypothetical protein
MLGSIPYELDALCAPLLFTTHKMGAVKKGKVQVTNSQTLQQEKFRNGMGTTKKKKKKSGTSPKGPSEMG